MKLQVAHSREVEAVWTESVRKCRTIMLTVGLVRTEQVSNT
jgi:hypothetical protein